MSATLTKKSRIDEMTNLIRKGETITAERKKHLSDKWGISLRRVQDYYNEAKYKAAQPVEPVKPVVELRINGTLSEIVRNPLLSDEQLEAVLSTCADGNLLAEKQIKINRTIERVRCLPNHHDRIYAADKLLHWHFAINKRNQRNGV
jgi:hypothetical protein